MIPKEHAIVQFRSVTIKLLWEFKHFESSVFLCLILDLLYI